METHLDSSQKKAPASKVFEKIITNAVHDQQGAKTLDTLAKGARGEIQHSGQDADAISGAMSLAAQFRMAKEEKAKEKTG